MDLPSLPSLLIAAAALVLGTLGVVHVVFTLHGERLHPRDPGVREAMERSALRITRQTTMWRANLGFNLSHGLGMAAFALVYGHLALARPEVLATSTFLGGLGMAVLLAYLALARRYFFRVPVLGVGFACGLYAVGWTLL